MTFNGTFVGGFLSLLGIVGIVGGLLSLLGIVGGFVGEFVDSKKNTQKEEEEEGMNRVFQTQSY